MYAQGDSFYLQFDNPTSSDNGVNLFQEGSSSLSTLTEQLYPTFVYTSTQCVNVFGSEWYGTGALTTNSVLYFKFYQPNASTSTDATINVLAGQTRAQFETYINGLLWTNFGSIPNWDRYNCVKFLDNADNTETTITFSTPYNGVVVELASPTPYVVRNFIASTGYVYYYQILPVAPYGTKLTTTTDGITIEGIDTVNELSTSQSGNSYKVDSLSVLQTSSSQLLEPVVITRLEANGNKSQHIITPTIDPYQYENVLLNVPTNGLVLDGNSDFAYTIKAFTSAKVIFNYKRVNTSELLESDYDIGNEDVLIEPIEHIKENYQEEEKKASGKKEEEEQKLKEILEDKPKSVSKRKTKTTKTKAKTKKESICRIYGIECLWWIAIGAGAFLYLNKD